MASKLCLCVLLFLAVSFASCKDGKRPEETVTFDVKPSGQISHEKLKLVSVHHCEINVEGAVILHHAKCMLIRSGCKLPALSKC